MLSRGIIGDIFQVVNLETTKTEIQRGWGGDDIRFKTKTTKPILYLVLPRPYRDEMQLYLLNPTSQFKYVDNTPKETISIYRDTDWDRFSDSLEWLGHVDEKTETQLKNFYGKAYGYGNWDWLRKAEKELYKEWSQVAKDRGFVEELVEGYKPKGQHLEFALDFIGQEVRVGDTVAYVNIGRGQEFQTATVLSITPDNFVLEALWWKENKQSRPHNYVIKVDPTKVRKNEY